MIDDNTINSELKTLYKYNNSIILKQNKTRIYVIKTEKGHWLVIAKLIIDKSIIDKTLTFSNNDYFNYKINKSTTRMITYTCVLLLTNTLVLTNIALSKYIEHLGIE